MEALKILATGLPFSPGQTVLIGAGCFCLLILAILNRKSLGGRRSFRTGPTADGVIRDVEKVMEELDRLSGEIQARLDAKIARIEALLRQADDVADRLSRIRRKAKGEPVVDVTVGDETTTPDEGAICGRCGMHEEIYRLADEGLRPLQVARKLGCPVGEVELILSLRRAALLETAGPR